MSHFCSKAMKNISSKCNVSALQLQKWTLIVFYGEQVVLLLAETMIVDTGNFTEMIYRVHSSIIAGLCINYCSLQTFSCSCK